MMEQIVQINKELFDNLIEMGVKKTVADQQKAVLTVAKMIGAYNRELKLAGVDWLTRRALLAQLQNKLTNG